MPRGWTWGKHRKSGYRSGLEEKVAASLEAKGIKFEYESIRITYEKPVRKGLCPACGSKSTVQVSSYTPDFVLDNGILLEVKGRLTSKDRSKLILVRKSLGDRGKYLVLYLAEDNRLTKGSEKRYSNWCQEKGFDFSIGAIPRRWLTSRKKE